MTVPPDPNVPPPPGGGGSVPPPPPPGGGNATPPPGGGNPVPPPYPGEGAPDSGSGGFGAGGYGPPGGTPGSFGPPEGNKAALWSMILGILGLLCCGLFASIPAIILALKARKEIEASGGRQTGSGQATAGLVLGVIATVISVIYFILLATGVVTPPEFDFSTS